MIVRRMRNARVVKGHVFRRRRTLERDGIYRRGNNLFWKKTARSMKKETLGREKGEERERNVSGVSW